MKNRFLLFFALLCTLGLAGNLNGQTQHWAGPSNIPTFAGGFNSSMFVTVYVDGVQVNNDNYELATFMGEATYTHNGVDYECFTMLGGQFPFVNDNGMNVYSLTIFGYGNADNSPTKNYFTIRLWDHENNIQLESSFEWLYTPQTNYGQALNPMPIHFYTQETMWEQVTDASTLQEGDILYFTNQAATYALGEEQRNNNRAAYPVTFENGQFNWDDPEPQPDPDDEEEMLPPSIYTVQEIIYHYAMWNDTYPTLVVSQGYLYAAGGGNYLRSSFMPVDDGIATDNLAWNITTAEDGTATLEAQGTITQKYMRFNNGSTKLFSCYNSPTNQQPICIYRRIVAPEVQNYTITVLTPENGTLSADKEEAAEGETITVTATADENYTLATLYYYTDDPEVTTDIDKETMTFEMPAANVTIGATFTQETQYYTLTVYVEPDEATADGCTYTVSSEPGENGYEANTTLTVTAVVPDEGWAFLKWKDGADNTLSTEAEYVFDITSNTTIWAVFEEVLPPVEPHTVTFAAGTGTCDVESLTEETGGAGITLPTATPCDEAAEAGYTFAGWATEAVPATPTAPELLNGNYAPEADITLYAVYVLPGTMEVATTLADGDVVYMTTETFKKELSGFGSTNVTFGEGADYTDMPAGLFPLTVVANSDDTYSFNTNDGYLFWDNTATNLNNLSHEEAITNYSKWNVTFNEDNTVAISPVEQDVARQIAWNNNSPRFAAYKESTVFGNGAANYGAITLYMAGEAGEFNTNPSCEAPQPETFTITVLTVENGTLTADKEEAEEGEIITVTATADENYTLTSLYYYTEDPEITTDIDMEAMTFEMPAANVTIGAVFTENEPETFTITVLTVENGTLTADKEEAEEGEIITVTATADENYTLTSLYYYTEDPEVTTDIDMEAMTFEMPAANVTIGAVFTENVTPVETYTITVLTVENGTLTADKEEAEEGEIITVTATADENYTLTSLYYYTEDPEVTTDIDMEAMTFEMPAANVTIGAVFTENVTPEPETYTINAVANNAEWGTVTGAGTYEEDALVTLNANANEGYHFVSWTENDAFVSSNATYSFTATADRDLVANFEEDEEPEPDTYTITVLEVENGVITAPATAHEGDEITVEATPAPLHILTNLYYYTEDPEAVTAIDLETMTFEMPAANVTIGAEFASVASLGDANDDGDVNILDVLTVLNYIQGKNPQPFDFEQADMNADGIIDIVDAMAINALIHGMKANCGEETAIYEVKDGMLVLESPVALAGYQFSLSAEPASIELAGFSTMGNWVNGEYILCVFNLNGEKEAGLYEVLNLEGAEVNKVTLATLTGCKVNAEKGTTSVNSLEANFNVYPVPATTTVMVEGEGINFIEVFNVMGQRVMTANTNEVNVSDLSAGTYMFRINTNNGVAVKSVVVVR